MSLFRHVGKLFAGVWRGTPWPAGETTGAPDAPEADGGAAAGGGLEQQGYGLALAAATLLVARHGSPDDTLYRLVEHAATATGARRVALWTTGEAGEPLTLLAWTATDGWQPDEALAAPLAASLPTVERALTTLLPAHSAPPTSEGDGAENAPPFLEQLLGGQGTIAACAATVDGTPNGVLAISDAGAGSLAAADGYAPLAASAALVGLVLERREATGREAVIDPYLTLPDREATVERLDMEIGRARRFHQPLAVLSLDIDRFGAYAKAAGPAAAEAFLRHITLLIRDSIHQVDILGRTGDDAFALLLPMSEIDDALVVGERIRRALAERQPEVAESVGHLTVSGGAAGYPNDGATAEELLDAAERTVAYAKRMGRDQIRLCGLGEFDDIPRLDEAVRPAEDGVRFVGEAFQGLLNALVAAGDLHDHAQPGHGRAVGRYARALAEACGLSPALMRAVELAGMLHDAGKIGLPESVVGKQGQLTDEERAILRAQPAVGKMMLAQIPSLEGVIALVEHGQERFDGGGHPNGLSGAQIPFGSRIIAIAEGYVAMTTDRPYRAALSRAVATDELWKEAGKRYDPQLVDTFVRLVNLLDGTQGGRDWKPELLERLTVDEGAGRESHAALAGDDETSWREIAPGVDVVAHQVVALDDRTRHIEARLDEPDTETTEAHRANGTPTATSAPLAEGQPATYRPVFPAADASTNGTAPVSDMVGMYASGNTADADANGHGDEHGRTAEWDEMRGEPVTVVTKGLSMPDRLRKPE